MADIELVIKISEEKYNEIHSLKFVQYGLQSEENKKFFYLLINAINDGTPLPKGHGRLIDADDVNNHIIGYVYLNSCPTIIEADKGDEE